LVEPPDRVNMWGLQEELQRIRRNPGLAEHIQRLGMTDHDYVREEFRHSFIHEMAHAIEPQQGWRSISWMLEFGLMGKERFRHTPLDCLEENQEEDIFRSLGSVAPPSIGIDPMALHGGFINFYSATNVHEDWAETVFIYFVAPQYLEALASRGGIFQEKQTFIRNFFSRSEKL